MCGGCEGVGVYCSLSFQILKLNTQCSDTFKLMTHACVSIFQSFMVYVAAFYGNLGNYKSFGDTKFIPAVSKVRKIA